MRGNYSFTKMISPEEAIKLFRYAKTTEIYIVNELFNFYREQKVYRNSQIDLLYLLSFIYDTGRVNGIREERAKRKERKRLL